MITLPDKPSELIRLALGDEAKCHKSKKYIVDMNKWHHNKEGICHVCLAGAVMAQSLYAGMENATPKDYSCRDQLHALDQFRVGMIKAGFEWLDIPMPEGLRRSMFIYPYEEYRGAWRKDMFKLCRLLEIYDV